MIRLAQVVRPAAGGIRRHVSLLLSRLDTAEFATTLFAPAGFTCNPVTMGLTEIPISIRARTSLLPDMRAISDLARRLRGRFDVVHAHGLRGALIGVPAARRAGIPALYTAHNLVSTTGIFQRWILRFLSRHAIVVAVSNAVADTLTAQGVRRDCIHIVPNGIDTTQFDAVRMDETARRMLLADLTERTGRSDASWTASWLRDAVNLDRPLQCIAAVGRIAPEKGFDTLITAFARLQSRPSQGIGAALLLLVLAGAGPQEASLRNAASKIAGVLLPGVIPDVAPLLGAADIVAIPSREEGQGIVALEAMAARRPVVASRVGGLVETVQNGVTGLLLPPDDPQAFCEALASLLASPVRRVEMGNAGRARVEEHYTLDRMVSDLSGLYRSAALKRA